MVEETKLSSKSGPICGDFGGVQRNGEPCGRRGQLCRSHSQEGVAVTQRLQDKFLEEYETGLLALKAAAKKAGVTYMTVWRWRRHDPHGFGKRLEAVQDRIDDMQLAMVEDSLVARCLKPDCPPVLLIFYLINRSGGRWRHVQRHEHSGPNGGPIRGARAEAAEYLSGDPVKRARMQELFAMVHGAELPALPAILNGGDDMGEGLSK